MDKLIIETKRYETHTATLAKLKDMFKNESYSYFAGTLAVNVPDLINDEAYVYVDVEPISEAMDTLESEIQYYTSKMYKKFKGSSCSFYKQAVRNINEYEAMA